MGGYVVFIFPNRNVIVYSFKYSYSLRILKQNYWTCKDAVQLKSSLPQMFGFLYLDFVFSVKYEGQDFYVGVGF